ncbi:MAG: YidC/Oxa1 family membrane protein insertase [Clostridia bacterium]|nr:YidC/Oxa1 family membrane protein insertase [Clostridia bacterium]
MLQNLLEVSTNFIDFAVEKMSIIDLNWIGTVIKWLIEGIGIVGVGIIVFTLALKTITLPLDVYSRVKMKKQSLLMKKMRPQMEKLQKQYANDKNMYSQKVMELQKQNGISMFGACLPMIVTLIIFMVVFGAFSTYSQYANLSTYNKMVERYNSSVQEYVYTDDNKDGFLMPQTDESIGETAYLVNFDAFKAEADKNSFTLPEGFDTKPEADKIEVVRGYVRENARRAAADYYRAEKADFLWVGNIWYPDSMLNKVAPDFSKFSSSVTRASGNVDASYEESYNEVNYYILNEGYLNENGGLEGKTYNGYFVLIVLAIGFMLLQQFISMRSQKDANELGTVDGSGARTNKWMLIMMPIIYGVFSFFYSAAFSIYMITSTLYGLASTLIINKVMDASFARQEANGGYVAKRVKNKNRKRLK